MLRKTLPLMLILLILSSCSQKAYSILTVLTNQRDMVLVAEYYNSVQEECRLSVLYDEYISLDDITTHSPDLIIGHDLNNPSLFELFEPVKPSEKIYPGLISDNLEDGLTRLVPLSFNLPVIVYTREQTSLPLVLDGEQLKEYSVDLNKESESHFTHMGFSPLWSEQFMYWYIMGKGITFCENGDFTYDTEQLDHGLSLVDDWIKENSQTMEQEERFTAKYRYIPDYKLLKMGIIDFVPMSFSDYVSLPGDETVGLSHSWLGNGEKIPPIQLVYAGILQESDKTAKAAEFLIWLTSETIQKELINQKGVINPGFALFNGFSSLEKINRLFLPESFPEKLGNKTFLPEQLGSPVEEPENWSAIKKDVIFPWLQDTIEGTTKLPLSAYYKEWQLQFID